LVNSLQGNNQRQKVFKKKYDDEDPHEMYNINLEDQSQIRNNVILRLVNSDLSKGFLRNFVDCKKQLNNIGIKFAKRYQTDEKFIVI